MRLALIHPRMDFRGGAERLIFQLANALEQQGHRIALCTQAYDAILWEDLGEAQFRIVELPRTRSRHGSPSLRHTLAEALAGVDAAIPFDTAAWRWTASTLRGHGPPVVWYCNEPDRKLYWEATERTLLQYLADAGDAAPEYLRRLGEDVRRADATGLRRLRSARKRGRDRRLLNYTHRVLANSAYTAESIRLALGVQATVCHCGIAPPTAPPANNPKAGVLVVSPLRPKKNIRTVFHALAYVKTEYGQGDVTLTIAGDGPQRAELEREATSLGLGDQVRFLGFVPDTKLWDLYGRTRAVVYVPIDEPFGLVVLEALACGAPVIVSDHGGPAELVQLCHHGHRVNAFEPRAIGEALVRVLGQAVRGEPPVAEDTLAARALLRIEAMAQRMLALLHEAPHRVLQ